jgi:tRNA 5-methylaminomethyl-2-thiouridine biosynthesis bifunctional protein
MTAAAASWCILDTDFSDGSAFLGRWLAWRAQSARSALLHYVGFLSEQDAAQLQQRLQHVARQSAEASGLAAALAPFCYGLGTGFHRIPLDDGLVSLTLCVGSMQPALTQQDMQADAVRVAGPDAVWDKWCIKALTRLCRRGTEVRFEGTPEPALWQDAGFEFSGLLATYNPRWEIRRTREGLSPLACKPGRCAIVGAGIAGASVARALAIRGWQVQVLDASAEPAGGASGLPAGLVVPHHSSDDNPRSQLSRCGARLTLQHATHLLEAGQDWKPGGVLERTLEATALDDTEAEVLSGAPMGAPSGAPQAGWASVSSFAGAPALWHPYGGWIKPARLVAQWLDHPRIRFTGQARVHALRQESGAWCLLNAAGNVLAQADVVVFANASGCVDLLQRQIVCGGADQPWLGDLADKLGAMQTLYGTLSYGVQPEIQSTSAVNAFPDFPINGHGSLISRVPTGQGPCWYAGSTFQTDPALHAELQAEHALNRRKLQTLLPAVAQAVETQFDAGVVQAWQGSRCVTHDRLPLVGPLTEGPGPTLWMSAGMGARGLSFSALCAELLAAELCGEPMPVEGRLRKALSTRRLLRKASKRRAVDS